MLVWACTRLVNVLSLEWYNLPDRLSRPELAAMGKGGGQPRGDATASPPIYASATATSQSVQSALFDDPGGREDALLRRGGFTPAVHFLERFCSARDQQ